MAALAAGTITSAETAPTLILLVFCTGLVTVIASVCDIANDSDVASELVILSVACIVAMLQS